MKTKKCEWRLKTEGQKCTKVGSRQGLSSCFYMPILKIAYRHFMRKDWWIITKYTWQYIYNYWYMTNLIIQYLLSLNYSHLITWSSVCLQFRCCKISPFSESLMHIHLDNCFISSSREGLSHLNITKQQVLKLPWKC